MFSQSSSFSSQVFQFYGLLEIPRVRCILGLEASIDRIIFLISGLSMSFECIRPISGCIFLLSYYMLRRQSAYFQCGGHSWSYKRIGRSYISVT